MAVIEVESDGDMTRAVRTRMIWTKYGVVVLVMPCLLNAEDAGQVRAAVAEMTAYGEADFNDEA